jgi:hypothetical protein
MRKHLEIGWISKLDVGKAVPYHIYSFPARLVLKPLVEVSFCREDNMTLLELLCVLMNDLDGEKVSRLSRTDAIPQSSVVVLYPNVRLLSSKATSASSIPDPRKTVPHTTKDTKTSSDPAVRRHFELAQHHNLEDTPRKRNKVR